MFLPLALVGVGFMLAGRKKPLTAVRKSMAFGTRTGQRYQVEEMPQSGTIVVHAADRSTMGLRSVQTPSGTEWHHVKSTGNAETLKGIDRDFNVHYPAPPPEMHSAPASNPEPTK